MSDNHPKKDLLTESTIQDIRLAAKQMYGEKRRYFQAEMAEKYCDGLAWKAAAVFKWNQKTVDLGLNEKRTGIICFGAQKLRTEVSFFRLRHKIHNSGDQRISSGVA